MCGLRQCQRKRGMVREGYHLLGFKYGLGNLSFFGVSGVVTLLMLGYLFNSLE